MVQYISKKKIEMFFDNIINKIDIETKEDEDYVNTLKLLKEKILKLHQWFL